MEKSNHDTRSDSVGVKPVVDVDELDPDSTVAIMYPVIEEPAVLRRLEQRSALSEITSNSTIAAAVMVFSAIAAVIVANSSAYTAVQNLMHASLAIGLGKISVSITFEQFVNDFLMAIFFMLVGVELKYEMIVGQLRRPRQAALPMLAAVGGVMVPAAIYLIINQGGLIKGWATPIATDIAFALGVMSLLGNRIAPETKIFFQTLAIADDILAIVVLALFFGQSISVPWTASSIAVILALKLLSSARVYSLKPYTIVGLILWVCMFNSGIHATLAGVIFAFCLPVRSDVRLGDLHSWLDKQSVALEDRYDDKTHVIGQHNFTEAAWHVERVLHHVRPPLQRAERNAAVPVNFVILPLFAFVNAQVCVVGTDPASLIVDPVVRGVFFGAVLGKPVGIIGMTLLLVKTGLLKLPKHVDWRQITAVGLLGGIGFTMSILIAGLAFPSAEANVAKCAILSAAIASSVLGLGFVYISDAIRANKHRLKEQDATLRKTAAHEAMPHETDERDSAT